MCKISLKYIRQALRALSSICDDASGGEGECYESKEESIPGNHILHGSILWMWFQE